MRIVLLSNYPLIDNKRWKQELILELSKKHRIFMIFGKKTLWAHARAYLKRRNDIDLKKRLAYGNVKTTRFLKENKVPYFTTHDINDNETRKILKKIKPDFGIAAVNQIIRKRIIDEFPILLNAHYGNLPNIKGWNATEWSILVEKCVSVSLHRIVAKVDSGEIFLKEPIRLEKNDDFEQIRYKCQKAAKKLYIAFFSDPEKNVRSARPNNCGRNYYLMNWQLKAIARKMVRMLGAGYGKVLGA